MSIYDRSYIVSWERFHEKMLPFFWILSKRRGGAAQIIGISMVGLRSVLSGSCADEAAPAQWLWSTESCDWKSAVCWGRGRWILASRPRSTLNILLKLHWSEIWLACLGKIACEFRISPWLASQYVLIFLAVWHVNNELRLWDCSLLSWLLQSHDGILAHLRTRRKNLSTNIWSAQPGGFQTKTRLFTNLWDSW